MHKVSSKLLKIISGNTPKEQMMLPLPNSDQNIMSGSLGMDTLGLGLAQLVPCLLCMHKALGSKPQQKKKDKLRNTSINTWDTA